MKSKQKQSKQETPKQAAAAKKTKKTDDKKASFKRPEPVKGALKPAKKQAYTFDFDKKTYASYDVSMLPPQSHPLRDHSYYGAHSYTLSAGGAAVEVLLRSKAYFVKRVAEGSEGPTGQVTFSKHGGACAAWDVAITRAGFVCP